MEVGDRLTQFVERQVGELSLEASEGLSCQFGGSGSDFLLRGRVLDKNIHAPVVALGSLVIEFAVLGGHELKDFAVDVGFASCLEFASDVVGHLPDVLLESLHVLEDVVVDALQEIGFFALVFGANDERVVDKSDFERLRLRHLIGNDKLI